MKTHENPIKMDDLGATPIFGNTRLETLITYDLDKEALYVNASSTQCWMAWDV